MREIKFRGWHTGMNKMFSAEEMGQDQLTIMPDGKGFINVSGTDTRLSQLVPHMIPMQYTGLKDKNGKEIYEGDICHTYELGMGNLNRVVQFDEGCFCFVHDKALTSEMRGWKTDFMEVIGNIHQNPEML